MTKLLKRLTAAVRDRKWGHSRVTIWQDGGCTGDIVVDADVAVEVAALIGGAIDMRDTVNRLHTPRPCSEWHDDDGCVLWWKMPIEEPPYVGSPLCSDWPWGHLPVKRESELWWIPLPDCNEIHKRYEAATAAGAGT